MNVENNELSMKDMGLNPDGSIKQPVNPPTIEQSLDNIDELEQETRYEARALINELHTKMGIRYWNETDRTGGDFLFKLPQQMQRIKKLSSIVGTGIPSDENKVRTAKRTFENFFANKEVEDRLTQNLLEIKKNIDEHGFIPGKTVNVMRSNGQTENDWQIAGIDNENGDVMVYKNDNDGQLQKNINVAELAQWNQD